MAFLRTFVSVFYLIVTKSLAESMTDEILSDLMLEFENMKNQINEQKDFYDNKIVAMETRLKEVESKLKTAQRTIESLTLQTEGDKDLTAGNLTMTSFGQPLTRRVTSANNRIAFTAFLSAHSVNNKIIPFDSILLNEGGAYNTATYEFTCPVYGTYVFQSAVMATQNSMTQTEIVKNGAGLVTQYAAGSTDSHGFDQGFNSVITQCSRGDRIWVQNYLDLGTTIFSSRYTTFSGFLLWTM